MPNALAGFSIAGDHTFILPSGWKPDGFGMTRTGEYLVFAANPRASGVEGSSGGTVRRTTGAETWVVDIRTGSLHRYAPLNVGWYSRIAVAGEGWVLREERKQLDGTECGQAASQAADCYRWRLYAQKLPAGTPVLIAESASPGPQSWAPLPVTGGGAFVWEIGTGAATYTVYRWIPGWAAAKAMARRSAQGDLAFATGGAIRLTEGRLLADGSGARMTTYGLSTSRVGQVTRIASFTASGTPAVASDRLAYFPNTIQGRIRVRTLNGRQRGVETNVGSIISGTYSILWLNKSKLLAWSPDGYMITDISRPSTSTKVADDALGLGAPRISDHTLCLVYTPMTGDVVDTGRNSIVAWADLSA